MDKLNRSESCLDDHQTTIFLEDPTMRKSIATVSALGMAFALSACDVKKTAEGNVTLPKYEKTQSGDVTLPKYDVKTPDVKVTKEEKTVTVPTITTEEKKVVVPSVSVTPAK
jgi:hypothetical protein